jgi:hypothetical protein
MRAVCMASGKGRKISAHIGDMHSFHGCVGTQACCAALVGDCVERGCGVGEMEERGVSGCRRDSVT